MGHLILILAWMSLNYVAMDARTCDDTRECQSTYVDNTTADIKCYGYQSCDSAYRVRLQTGAYDIFCYSYESCRDASYISNQLGNIECYGPLSCYSVTSYIASYGDESTVDCNGWRSCGYSNINSGATGSTLLCGGEQSCLGCGVAGFENIYVDGYFGAQAASISSLGTPDSTMNVYLRGHGAGNDLTLTCQSAHTCNLYCEGTGCNNTDLVGSGTWIVDCDNSHEKWCPNGYTGPSSLPTEMPSYTDDPTPNPSPNPSNNPTTSPTGGLEAIDCTETGQCQYQSLTGLSVDCNGYQACMGSSNQSIEGTTGYVSCDSAQSCNGVGTITAATYVSCGGESSCYGSDIMSKTNDIYCDGVDSCGLSSLTTTCNDLFCTSTRSCSESQVFHINRLFGYGRLSLAYSNMSNISYVYGYGVRSFNDAYITHKSGTSVMTFKGHYAGDRLTIDCQTDAICYIYCGGTGCYNITLNCDGDCTVECDESQNIDCPNGYYGPTSQPTQSTSTMGTTAATTTAETTAPGTSTSMTTTLTNTITSSTITQAGSTSPSTTTTTTTDIGRTQDSLTASCTSTASSIKDLDGTLFYVFWLSWIFSLILLIIIVAMCIKVKDEKKNKLFLVNQVSALSPKLNTTGNGTTFPFATPGSVNNNNNNDKRDSMLPNVNLQATSMAMPQQQQQQQQMQMQMQMQLAAQAQAQVQAQARARAQAQAQVQAAAVAMANAASFNAINGANINDASPAFDAALPDLQDEDIEDNDENDELYNMPPIGAPGHSHAAQSGSPRGPRNRKIGNSKGGAIELAQNGDDNVEGEIIYEGQAETGK